MVLRPANALGVGTGQPDRIDQHGDQHQALLRVGDKLQIPKSSVDAARNRESTDTEVNTGWDRHEHALRQVGGQRENDARSFLHGEGRRSNQGSVEIDGSPIQAPTFKLSDLLDPSGKPKTGWENLDKAHLDAAEFEEWGRDNAPQVGLGSELDVEVSEVTGKPKKQKPIPRRRAYRVA